MMVSNKISETLHEVKISFRTVKKKTPKILERNKTNKNNKAIKGDHLKTP